MILPHNDVFLFYTGLDEGQFTPFNSTALNSAPAQLLDNDKALALELTNHNHDSAYYTQAQVDAKIIQLLDSAPAVLNTFNELAQAIGDDPDFALNVFGALNAKVDNSRVLTDVPLGALFTDTIYEHPLHKISDIGSLEEILDGLLDKNGVAVDSSKLAGLSSASYFQTHLGSGDGIDMDTVYTVGSYSYTSNSYNYTTLNGPQLTSGAGMLFVYEALSLLFQTYETINGNRYTRSTANISTPWSPWVKQTKTLTDLGFTGDLTANNYSHPSYTPKADTSSTGVLTGAQVISALSITLNSDSSGHVTELLSDVTIRTLTAADLGINPLTDALVAAGTSTLPGLVNPAQLSSLNENPLTALDISDKTSAFGTVSGELLSALTRTTANVSGAGIDTVFTPATGMVVSIAAAGTAIDGLTGYYRTTVMDGAGSMLMEFFDAQTSRYNAVRGYDKTGNVWSPWVVFDVSDAPSDGTQYARQDGGWAAAAGGTGGVIALKQDGSLVAAEASELNFTDGLYVTDQGVIRTSKPAVLDWSYSLADPATSPPLIDGTNNGLSWTGTTGAGFSSLPIVGLATLLPTGSYTEFTVPSAATVMSMLNIMRGLPFIDLFGPTEYDVLSMGLQNGTFFATANDQTDNSALAEEVATASVTFGLEIASTGIYLHRSGVRTLISSETTSTGFAVANLNAEQNGGTLTASFNPTATPPASVEAGVLSLSSTPLLYPTKIVPPPTVYSDYPAIVSNSNNITVGTTFDVPSKNFVLEVSSYTTTLTIPDVTALPALLDVSEIIIRQTYVSADSTVTLLGTGDVTIVGNSVCTGTGMMRAVRVGPNKWTLVSDIPRQLGTLANLNSGNSDEEVRTNAQLRAVYAFDGLTPLISNLDTWVPTGTSMQRYTVTSSATGHPSSGPSIMEWVPSGATLSGVATLTVLSGVNAGNVYSRVRDDTAWVNTWGELAKIGGSVAPEPSGLRVSKDWTTFTGTEFQPLEYLNHYNYDGMVVEIEEFSHVRAGANGAFGVLSYFYSNFGTWEQVPASNQFTKHLDAIIGETTSVTLGAGIFNTVGKYSTMSARLEFSSTGALGTRTKWHGVKATTHGVTGDEDADNTRSVDTTALVGFAGSKEVIRSQIVFSESVTFRYRVTSKTS